MSERGSPYIAGPAERVMLDFSDDLVRALDTWTALQPMPQPGRTTAVLTALRDWLTP